MPVHFKGTIVSGLAEDGVKVMPLTTWELLPSVRDRVFVYQLSDNWSLHKFALMNGEIWPIGAGLCELFNYTRFVGY